VALLKGKKGPKALLPWEADFCRWYHNRPKCPPQVLQVDKANKLIEKHTTEGEEVGAVNYQQLRRLRGRKIYQEYGHALQRGGKQAAREMLEVHYPQYAEMHYEAAQMAMVAGDYSAIPKFTGPMIDRIEPRMQRGADAHTGGLVINITVAQNDLLADAEKATEDVVDVEFEEILEDPLELTA